MDICHLKNTELESKFQKFQGQIVLRDDIVKHDSDFYAVFTEQESSASQMRAVKAMNIIARLSGCAGQAADAVSANLQNKMEDQRTCIVEAHESTRKRLDSTLPKDHVIPENGSDSSRYFNLMHKLIPMSQAMQIPDAKAVVDKEWKQLETIPA